MAVPEMVYRYVFNTVSKKNQLKELFCLINVFVNACSIVTVATLYVWPL